MGRVVCRTSDKGLHNGLPAERGGSLQIAVEVMNMTSTQSLSDFHKALGLKPHFDWAFDNYKSTVVRLVKTYGATDILEIGGGRTPLFSPQEVQELGVRYTVNDISQEELDAAPSYLEKVCFDVAGDVEQRGNAYDLIFSQMVFEHVRDARRAHKTIWNLLARGGIAFNFFPTLYAPPFVINKITPFALTKWVRSRFFPEQETYKRFPARYSLCRGTDVLPTKLADIGFSQVEIIPFYDYDYFEKVPVVRGLARRLSDIALRRDWRIFASYVYCIARK